MNDEELIQQWEIEEDFAFEGWDFSHLEKLFSCQREIIEKSFLEGTGHRFLLVAQKCNIIN